MRIPRKRSRRGLSQIYRIPLALAAISLFGLVAALLVDGPLDFLWVLAIAAPLFALARAAARTG